MSLEQLEEVQTSSGSRPAGRPAGREDARSSSPSLSANASPPKSAAQADETPRAAGLQVLEGAHAAAQLAKLPFAGSVTAPQAWALFSAGLAKFVDVRSPEELKFVGKVPGALAVPWATGTSLVRNPRFVRELEAKVGGRDAPVLLLCRSGKRSAEAAAAATRAGFAQVFNVLEGFEGYLDANKRRGASGGWRHDQLPWEQD